MKVQNKEFSPLGVIYAVSILLASIWMLVFGPMEYNDTAGYLAAYTNNLSQGRIDTFRTPLYPLLLGWTRDIFGIKVFPWIIMVLQYAIFLISIKFFYSSALCFLPKSWSLGVTAFYALYPTFGTWSNLLLTESLELSFSVFLMYASLKLILDKDWRYAIYIFVFVMLLLALRPSSVVFLPALAVPFMILLFRKSTRRNGLLGLLSIFIASVILLGYSTVIEKKTDLFTPSLISVHNNYWMADKYGYLDHEVDLDTADISEIQAVVSESIKNNKRGWITGLALRFYEASLMPSLTSYTSQLFRVHPLYPVNIGIVLLLLLAYLVILIPGFRNNIPVDSLFLLVTSGGIIALSIIGAQYEWNRLILPAQPMILIIIAQLFLKNETRLSHHHA